jgi:ABC-2 type transport system ATP-binding protein
MTHLSEIKNRLTKDLSQGWKQRLALASSLLHEPEILFLDEPTSGVDPVTRRHFWNFIGHLSRNGMTVFVTTHYMDEARNCDRLVMLNKGKTVISGSPSQIIGSTCPDRPNADLNDAFISIMS